MTTIGNAPSTAAVALVLSGRVTDAAACPGQRQDLFRHARRAPAPRGSVGASSAGAPPAARSARPESGLR